MLINFFEGGRRVLLESGCSLTFWRGEESLTRVWVLINSLEGGGGSYLSLGAH